MIDSDRERYVHHDPIYGSLSLSLSLSLFAFPHLAADVRARVPPRGNIITSIRRCKTTDRTSSTPGLLSGRVGGSYKRTSRSALDVEPALPR